MTGASRGIGEAVAKAFAAEGCSVVAVSRSCEEKTVEMPGGGSITYRRMNVSDAASVESVVSAMESVEKMQPTTTTYRPPSRTRSA